MRPLWAATRSTWTPRMQWPRPVRFEQGRARNKRVVGARASSLGKPDKSSDAFYRDALSRARECIFSAPEGQLLGRAGRKSSLEDGERNALRAVASRPSRAAEARLLLAQSLVAQARGREIEVPKMVVEALRVTEAGSLSAEVAVGLVEAAGVAFEKGAGATTGFASVELFVRAVSEAAAAAPCAAAGGELTQEAAAAADGVRDAVEAAAAAVAARTEVAKERAQREEVVERASSQKM